MGASAALFVSLFSICVCVDTLLSFQRSVTVSWFIASQLGITQVLNEPEIVSEIYIYNEFHKRFNFAQIVKTC